MNKLNLFVVLTIVAAIAIFAALVTPALGYGMNNYDIFSLSDPFLNHSEEQLYAFLNLYIHYIEHWVGNSLQVAEGLKVINSSGDHPMIVNESGQYEVITPYNLEANHSGVNGTVN